MRQLQHALAAFSAAIAFLLPMGASAVAPSISFDEEVQFSGGQNATAFAPGRIDDTHFILAYGSGGSVVGVASIGTVSGDTVTFGPAYAFAPDGTQFIDLAMIDATRAIIVYTNPNNSDHGTAVVATISGTSVSYGTPVEFASGSLFVNSSVTYVTALDETHFAIAYAIDPRDDPEASSAGYVVAGTVSGTDLTLGAPVAYADDEAGFQQIAALNETHFVLSYRTDSNYAVIGTVSGTSVSLGTPVESITANASQNSVVALDATHIIVGFSNGDADSAVTLVGGVVSGTDVTFGEPITMPGATQNELSFAAVDAAHAAFVYQEYSDGGRGKGAILTLDGTTLSRSDVATFFDAGDAYLNQILKADDDTVIVFTSDQGAGYEGYYAFGTVTLPASSSSSSSSSSQSSSAEPRSQGGGRRGGPGRGGAAKPLSVLRSASPARPAASVRAAETSFEIRTCERAMKWFGNDAKMLGRVNERLRKRLGFACGE